MTILKIRVGLGIPAVFVVIAGLALAMPLSAEECPWTLVNPLPVTRDLSDVEFHDGVFVAVGEHGTVLYSADRIEWQVIDVASTSNLSAVAWFGDRFVAVGADGTILLSENGLAWSAVHSGTGENLRDVAASPTSILAVGEGGTVLTSTDARLWSEQAPPTNKTLRSAVWADPWWIAVGSGATVLTSRDGVIWSETDQGRLSPFIDVASDGELVITTDGFGIRAGRVDDGALRFQSVGDSNIRSTEINSLSFCDDGFIAVGPSGGQGFSTDGLNWIGSSDPMQRMWLNGIACHPDGPVAVGPGGLIASSPDGHHWRRLNSISEVSLTGLASDGERIVAVGGNPNRMLWETLTSEDGVRWKSESRIVSSPLHSRFSADVVFGDGRFVAIATWYGWFHLPSYNTVAAVSEDGVNWTMYDTGPWGCRSITWDGRFIAAGYHLVASSLDGEVWEWHYFPDHDLRGVASNGETVVAVGRSGAIVVSEDLDSWIEVEHGSNAYLNEVAWGGERFVAVGDRAAVLASYDGITWSQVDVDVDVDLLDIEWTGNDFVIVGDQGTVLKSAPSVLRFTEVPGLEGDLRTVTSFGEELVVAGTFGHIAVRNCYADEQVLDAMFSWLPSPLVAGDTARFYDHSRGEPDRWNWSFGDGATSDAENPSHRFDLSGAFPVDLQIQDEHSTGYGSAVVEVIPQCGAPSAPHPTAPPVAASGTDFAVTWLAEQADDRYVVEEADTADFRGTAKYETAVPEMSFSHIWTDRRQVFYRVRALRTCFDGIWQSPWSSPVEVSIVPDLRSPGTSVKIVPVAASSRGLHDSQWTSELVIHNPGADPATAVVFLLDGDGGLDQGFELEVEAGATRRLENVVSLLADEELAAALMIGSNQPLNVDSSTSNDTGHGVFHQRIPAVALDEIPEIGHRFQFTGLERSSTSRSNLGFANPFDEEQEVVVTVSHQGQTCGSVTITVPGYGFLMLVDLLAKVGLDTASGASAEIVLATDSAGVLAFSSVIDNRTGDAVTRVAGRDPELWSMTATPTLAIPPYDQYWHSFAFGHGVYAMANNVDLVWSPNAREWTRYEPVGYPDGPIPLEFNGTSFLGLGFSSVTHSSDGRSWATWPWPDRPWTQIRGLAWNSEVWMAVGEGAVVRSPTGEHWSVLEPLSDRSPSWVVAVDQNFVTSSNSGAFVTADNGDTWTEIENLPGFNNSLTEPAWNGSIAIATAWQRVVSSVDGFEWLDIGDIPGYGQIVWAGDEFVIVGSTYFSSPDGRSWQEIAVSPVAEYAKEIRWDGRKLVSMHGREFAWAVPNGPSFFLSASNGATETTDAEIHNGSASTVSCSVELLPVDSDNSEPLSMSITVAPATTKRIEDVLGLFDFDGAAALRFVPDSPGLAISGRAWSSLASGSRGRFLPGLAEDRSVWHFEEGRLIGLRSEGGIGAMETRIGIASLCSAAIEVEIEIFSDAGEPVQEVTVSLPPYGVFDYSVQPPANSSGDLYAVLTTDQIECSFHAWAILREATSGDTLLVPVMKTPPRPATALRYSGSLFDQPIE